MCEFRLGARRLTSTIDTTRQLIPGGGDSLTHRGAVRRTERGPCWCRFRCPLGPRLNVQQARRRLRRRRSVARRQCAWRWQRATPGGPSPPDGESRLLLLMGSAWPAALAMLSAAAQMSGGHPRASLTYFVQSREGWLSACAMVLPPTRGGWSKRSGKVTAAVFWLVLVALSCSVAVVARSSLPSLRRGAWHETHGGGRPRAAALSVGTNPGHAQAEGCVVIAPAHSLLGVAADSASQHSERQASCDVRPGRGKTSALVVPNLLEWRGPAVVQARRLSWSSSPRGTARGRSGVHLRPDR